MNVKCPDPKILFKKPGEFAEARAEILLEDIANYVRRGKLAVAKWHETPSSNSKT